MLDKIWNYGANLLSGVQQYHTKLARKLCNNIFILLWIYYTILGTYSQHNWTDVLRHLIILLKLHELKQPCTREKQKHLFPSYTSFNVVHVATCSLLQEPKTITPQLPPMHGIFEGSKEVEICGSEIWAVWWVDRNSLSELFNCFLCFQTCVWSHAVMLKEFSNIFFKIKLS